jgi:putative glutamine amidotransferase
MKKILCLILILQVSLVSLAEVRLIVWQTAPNAPKIILPQTKNETAELAIERYLKHVRQIPELSQLSQKLPMSVIGQIKALVTETPGGRTRLVFIANQFSDMSAEGERIQRNIKTFSNAGAETYVIAIAADLGLSPKEQRDYHTEVAKNFSLLVALGGDDIAPELYEEKTTYARDTNLTRDQSELKLVQSYKKYGRGVFFGICRGHQMGAIADGHKLYQDLTLTKSGTTNYHINLNGQTTTQKQTWHGIDIDKSLLSRFLGGANQLWVNSIHHQAVKINPHASSSRVAVDDKDQIVEALQSENNKSLSVQFHPEFPADTSGNSDFSDQGFKIIKGIINYARLQRQNHNQKQCLRLF